MQATSSLGFFLRKSRALYWACVEPVQRGILLCVRLRIRHRYNNHQAFEERQIARRLVFWWNGAPALFSNRLNQRSAANFLSVGRAIAHNREKPTQTLSELSMLQQLISSKRILRAQLLEFLGFPETSKEKKEILVPLILSILETDPAAKERFLERFKSELAVEPYELMQFLQCSKTERKRWIKEGKLPILEYRYFRQSGIDMEYPVHDRRAIMSLSQEEIQRWREEHKNRVKENRKIGSQVAVESRKENERSRQDFVAAWEKIREEWQQKGSAEISAILQLAYWTVWASRWAKENQIKSKRAIKYSPLYERRKEEWYKRKNEAVELLFKTPYASLSFYRPEKPDKRYFSLCEEHCNLMLSLDYCNKWDFLYFYHEEIKQCPHCLYQEYKDDYSLYYLEVKIEQFPEFSFSFHTPYAIGKDFLPEPPTLPKVNHSEQDGIFRFGRPLLEYEKIIHREKDVLAALEKAIAAVKNAGDRT